MRFQGMLLSAYSVLMQSKVQGLSCFEGKAAGFCAICQSLPTAGVEEEEWQQGKLHSATMPMGRLEKLAGVTT